MSINLDLSAPHKIVAANSHYYKQPTEVLYINRVMPLHDLVYLVQGGWAVTESEVEYPLEKDDILLLAAGRHHYTRLPCLPETRTMCIHVTCEGGDNRESAANINLPTLVHLKGTSKVRGYLEEIIATLWSDTAYKNERMSALFDLVMCELANTKLRNESPKPDVADEAVRIVNTTPHRFFRVSEVADMLYISAKTLENAMQRKTGMSFSKYQMNRKLEMVAMQLDTEPYVRLKEIAAAFGFYDEFHMSKAFKQKYGLPPKNFRAIQAERE